MAKKKKKKIQVNLWLGRQNETQKFNQDFKRPELDSLVRMRMTQAIIPAQSPVS